MRVCVAVALAVAAFHALAPTATASMQVRPRLKLELSTSAVCVAYVDRSGEGVDDLRSAFLALSQGEQFLSLPWRYSTHHGGYDVSLHRERFVLRLPDLMTEECTKPDILAWTALPAQHLTRSARRGRDGPHELPDPGGSRRAGEILSRISRGVIPPLLASDGPWVLSSNGSVAAVTVERELRVLEVETARVLFRVPIEESEDSETPTFALSGDGSLFAIARQNASAADSGWSLSLYRRANDGYTAAGSPSPLPSRPVFVEIVSGGTIVLVQFHAEELYIFDTYNLSLMDTARGFALTYEPDGHILGVSDGSGFKLLRINPDGCYTIRHVEYPGTAVPNVVYTPSGDLAVSIKFPGSPTDASGYTIHRNGRTVPLPWRPTSERDRLLQPLAVFPVGGADAWFLVLGPKFSNEGDGVLWVLELRGEL